MGEKSQTEQMPKKFGKYNVLKRLGQGGMSTVYLAEDPILERKVALKVLLPSLAGSEEYTKRFYQEARFHAKLAHPNIVTLHEVGEQDGMLYLAMEYVEGPNLSELAEGEGPPPVLIMLRIMAKIAGVLQHCHEREIIHKDIKPETILVAPTGEPFLTDFGIAAPVSGDPLLREGMVAGSVFFMPPEQWQGKVVSPRADIWAMGATTYSVLTGRPPYEAERPLDVGKQVVSLDPVDLSLLKGKAPEYVVNIIARCLQKNPNDRYQSADDLKRALEAAIDHMEMSESDTIEMAPPREGQTLLLHVEYQESDLPGAYREYEFGPRISGGNYGEVFRAKERLSGKTMALKVLKREWVGDQETVARFRREAMLLSRLSHPNIVRVYNFGRYGASFFIAMELLGEKTLEDVIRERAPLDPAEAVSFILPVLAGLDELHRAGAVHRDLKPSNIAVMEDRTVVFDFGMARAKDMQKLTLSGVILGSPAYMSPEQASGTGATGASDVYSAGVVLYEMLSGALPHEDESTLSLLQRIASDPPVPITERRDDVPGGVLEAIDRMLAKEPEARLSAAEAAGLLREAVD